MRGLEGNEAGVRGFRRSGNFWNLIDGKGIRHGGLTQFVEQESLVQSIAAVMHWQFLDHDLHGLPEPYDQLADQLKVDLVGADIGEKSPYA